MSRTILTAEYSPTPRMVARVGLLFGVVAGHLVRRRPPDPPERRMEVAGAELAIRDLLELAELAPRA
jgi:hypothetical protein